MNTLVIVLIAAVCLVCAYAGYGRWIAKNWGIDPNAKTPAVRLEDGKDYVPTNGWTVFSHQFSSIAGAGPVTGAIQAAAFGWLPVLLWVLLGGIFFGAVTDFGALYASVKNDGKSMGMLIEKYIGKLGRRLFLLFCWLFTLLVIAAFADMILYTFGQQAGAAFQKFRHIGKQPPVLRVCLRGQLAFQEQPQVLGCFFCLFLPRAGFRRRNRPGCGDLVHVQHRVVHFLLFQKFLQPGSVQ